MKRHMLTHSGAKPYSCDFCDKSYTDNYSLKQHVAKVHPGVASTLPHMMITPRTKKQPNAENKVIFVSYRFLNSNRLQNTCDIHIPLTLLIYYI